MQNNLNDSAANLNNATEGKQTVSLDSPGVTKSISKRLLYDIDSHAIKTYYEPHRWHLGASIIGHDCSRYLWYTFRWCGKQVGQGKTDEEKHANLGRMQRLFNRGHLEENRVVGYLKGIGCEVWTHHENGDQFRMSAVNNHYGGSLDGILKLPPAYKIDEPLLWENKTNATGQAFNELLEKGIALSKPQHFIQSSCYGNEYKLRYAVYTNTNKNDDNIYIEIVKLNFNIAEQMKVKAERIIVSQEPPPRLAENPTFHKCVYCDMKQICHFKAKPEVNCRSCIFAEPRSQGEWNCNFHNGIIPREFVPQACPQYKPIVNAA